MADPDDVGDPPEIPYTTADCHIVRRHLDKLQTISYVNRIAVAIRREQPSAEIVAGSLMVAWCALHPQRVQDANAGIDAEQAASDCWEFVQAALEWMTVYDVPPAGQVS